MNVRSLNKASNLKWICILFLIPPLLMAISGCAISISRAATADSVSAVTACQASQVTITGVHWFKDSGGAWRVVGVITNNSSKAISKIVTGVETRNKYDQPVDQGEDISAYPLNLQPGEQAPYTAWIDREIPGLDYFEVEINECVLAEPADRGQVAVRAGRMAVDEAGTAQVSAELYNPANNPMLINGLMAAVYDQKGVLVTAQYANIATRQLAPGESGPVRASLDLPPGAAAKIASYKFFMDALISQPADLPLRADNEVRIVSRYTDKNGHFHLVGQITNPTNSGVMTSVQATAYADSARSQVVDAAELSTWLPLMPGETRLFDLNEWGALNHTTGLWDELASQNAVIDLRLEPFLSWTTAATAVSKLSILKDTTSFYNQQAFFTGKVENDTGNGITNGLVTAIVRQKSNEQVVASGTARLEITDSAVPGQIMEYSIIVPLPANLDPATLQTEVIAEGTHP